MNKLRLLSIVVLLVLFAVTPMADNKTEEGKAKNRRVEIVKK